MRPIDADKLLNDPNDPNVRRVDEFDEIGESVSYLAVPVECIEKAPTIDYAPKWISVKDRLPESSADVLVFVNGIVDIGYHTPTRKYWNCYSVNGSVTHWMPLPKTPKEEM